MTTAIKQNRPAVVILSGGQDSTTAMFWAKEQGFSPLYAITVDYGQKHKIETEAAIKVAEMAGISPENHRMIWLGKGNSVDNLSMPNSDGDVEILDGDFTTEVLLSASPLIDRNAEVGQYAGANDLPGGVEPTFVPYRNVLLITLAANYAASLGVKDLVMGICQADYGGYPDCRETFRNQMEHTLNLAFAGKWDNIHLHAPLMHLAKSETVALADSIPGAMEALAYTHTCYEGKYPPGPHNHASILRAKGFHEANKPDPLIVRAKAEGLLPENYPDDGYVEGTEFALPKSDSENSNKSEERATESKTVNSDEPEGSVVAEQQGQALDEADSTKETNTTVSGEPGLETTDTTKKTKSKVKS